MCVHAWRLWVSSVSPTYIPFSPSAYDDHNELLRRYHYVHSCYCAAAALWSALTGPHRERGKDGIDLRIDVLAFKWVHLRLYQVSMSPQPIRSQHVLFQFSLSSTCTSDMPRLLQSVFALYSRLLWIPCIAFPSVFVSNPYSLAEMVLTSKQT